MRPSAADTALASLLALPPLASHPGAASVLAAGAGAPADASALSSFLSRLIQHIFRQRLQAEAEVQQQSSLLRLPDEMLCLILEHLPLCSRLTLRPTCRRLYNLANAAGTFRDMLPTDKLDFLGAYEHDAHTFAFDQVPRATCSFHLTWHKTPFFLQSELNRSHYDRQCLLIGLVWFCPRLSFSALELAEILQQQLSLCFSKDHHLLQPVISQSQNRRKMDTKTMSRRFTVGHIPPDFHADLAVEKISFRCWQLKLKTWVSLSQDWGHAMQKLRLMDIPLCNHSTVCDLFRNSNEDPNLLVTATVHVCSYSGCMTSCTVQLCPKEASHKFSPQSYVLHIERIIHQSRSPQWKIDANVWRNYAFPHRKLIEMELQWKKHIGWN